MRLIMVRHGEPDYEKDCLTETGRQQARAAAERLAREDISEIYSSPMGRARETAEFTAERLGQKVHVLDYMHEISWGGPGLPENGHPWTLADRMISEDGCDFTSGNWREHPYFRGNDAVRYYDMIAGKIDLFMKEKGYLHAGPRFLCGQDTDRTIALFSHGGSGGCALAHLLSMPFPYVLTVLPYDFTSVIILNFPDSPGEYVHPRLELFNDTSHFLRTATAPAIQREPDRDKP